MELYDSKYVYFDWDDKLEGKKGFFADSIYSLKQIVKDNRTMWLGEIRKNISLNTAFPFEFVDDNDIRHPFQFCYYDPYYEFRKAYIEGKQLQFKNSNGDWEDIVSAPVFTTDEYRIKPEIKWHVVLSDEDTLGIAKSTDKHIYFTGYEEECAKWIDEHEHLTDIMEAWEEGKTIQYLYHDVWNDVANNIPLWGLNDTYRVKPDDCEGCMKYNYCANKDGIRCTSYCTKTEYVPFDTLDELIHKWESMNPGCTNRPKCAMPMMWVKRERDNTIHLIVDYYPDGVGPRCSDVGTDDEHLTLKELFEDYRFINDSIIGKVKEI